MHALNYLTTRARAWWWLVDHWYYPGGRGRDLRLDYLRGFAVFAMIVDHLGSASWFHPLTGGNSFFVSAAEGFVFISGLLVGIVYGDLMRKQGWRAAARKALARAWTLYTLTVPLTILFVAGIFWLNLPFASWYTIGEDPWRLIISIITLQRTFVFADIPLLYTQLLVIAPLGLAFLQCKSTAPLLGLSLGIWGAYQVAPEVMDRFPWQIEGNWIFHIAAWQLLFIGALALGYHREEASAWFNDRPRWPMYLALWAAFGLLLYIFPQVNPDDPLAVALFDKGRLGVGRLVSAAIIFPLMYLTLTLFWKPLHKMAGWLLNPLGENSLYSYTLHIFWLIVFYTVLPWLTGDPGGNVALNSVLQIVAVLLTRLAIQNRVLFKIIPR
ncbi:MAG: OpgC domain-containing protein [Chloroflexi bacterium]|nr:OpgC domain-containing protein [Chloroflexota bacterium]